MAGKTKRAAASRNMSMFIRIACRDGITQAPAIDIGADGRLAIHESVSTPGAYKITHVPTGTSIFRSNVTLEVARVRLRKIAVLDWRFDDPQDMPDATREYLRDGWPQMGYMHDEDYAAWRRHWTKGE
jgi:hypothetical protein